MKDNKFTNILRMNKKSLYQLVGQSKESNMRILPIFKSNLVISTKMLYTILIYGSEQVHIVTRYLMLYVVKMQSTRSSHSHIIFAM